jgi:hypothetical protein
MEGEWHEVEVCWYLRRYMQVKVAGFPSGADPALGCSACISVYLRGHGSSRHVRDATIADCLEQMQQRNPNHHACDTCFMLVYYRHDFARGEQSR